MAAARKPIRSNTLLGQMLVKDLIGFWRTPIENL
jgi:hypothetical protein